MSDDLKVKVINPGKVTDPPGGSLVSVGIRMSSPMVTSVASSYLDAEVILDAFQVPMTRGRLPSW